MVENGRRHRAPMDARGSGHVAHIEDFGDKGEVGPIVGEIAEGDQRDVEADGTATQKLLARRMASTRTPILITMIRQDLSRFSPGRRSFCLSIDVANRTG